MPTKQRGELIALANADQTDNTMVIQVLRAGEFTDMNGKAFTVDSAVLAEFVSNSNALLTQQQIPTQIGHPDDPGAPASGWYKRFFTKVVEGVEWVCAQVELTKVGAEALAADLYKYFSAELYTTTKEIVGGGFVNYPAVGGQQVVGTLALSAYLHPKEQQRMDLKTRIAGLFRQAQTLLQLEMSQEETQGRLWDALRSKYADPLDEYGSGMPWLKATYDDHVIVEKGGECFSITYSVDGDGNVTLGEPVAVEIVYQPKAEAAAQMSRPLSQGGENTMTEQEKIQAAVDAERTRFEGQLRDQDAKIEAAVQAERTRLLAETKRKDEVHALSTKLTTGKFAFPQKPDELEAVLLQLSDTDRALVTPILEKIQLSGLVDLGEHGHSRDVSGLKQLDAPVKALLSQWVAGKQTVAEFFKVNPELGKADEYDLAAFAV